MYTNHSEQSLFADVMAGVETGAAIGKCVTGIAGAVTGGLTDAIAGCLYWLVIKPFQSWEE